jgi:superfamily II DNA/RNA helicase
MAEEGLSVLSYHGELHSQTRDDNLNAFRSGNVSYLVCSDIASRGIDIPEVRV